MDQVSYNSEMLTSNALQHVDMISPAGGISLWTLGVLVTLKVLANETGGTYSVFEDIVPPGLSPPAHIHTREDEYWYMLDGELIWKVGDRSFHATKGCFIHLPRLVPHTFINVSDKPAQLLVTYAPGGLEKWFLEVGEPVADRNAPGNPPPLRPDVMKKAAALAAQYGVTWPEVHRPVKDEL